MQIEKMIHQMEQDSSQYHYSRLGVFLCILHIPFKMRQRYFCSQFVMEMLSLTGSVSLRKKPCLYLPNHLPEELQRQKCLMQVNYNQSEIRLIIFEQKSSIVETFIIYNRIVREDGEVRPMKKMIFVIVSLAAIAEITITAVCMPKERF